MNQRFKYGRTFHLDFSDGIQNDDKIISNLDNFINKDVVATLKYDGEQTSLYSDGYMHARSIDSKSNYTRDIAKKIHSLILQDIPEGFRLCCENLYAKHSIYYPDDYLEGYLYLLSVWDDKNYALSWDDTKIYAQLLDLPTPKELYRGPFDYNKIKNLVKDLDASIEEGFVVRLTNKIHYNDFSNSFIKYVRKGHVQNNSKHWLEETYPNGKPKNPSKPKLLNLDKIKYKK